MRSGQHSIYFLMVESTLFLIGTGFGVLKKRDEDESKISDLRKWMYGIASTETVKAIGGAGLE